MKISVVLAVLILFAFAAAAAAVDVRISESNYSALGWTKTLKTGAEAGQSVTFDQRTTTVPPNVEEIVVSPKRSASNNLSWAGLSTNLFDGRAINTISHFKIRVAGFEGDGSSWEAPSIYLQLSKDGLNQRNVRFLPYASYGRGTTWTFYEYDLVGPNAKWFCMIDGVVRLWSSVLTTWPAAIFDSTVTTALPSGQVFNVFNGCAINNEVTYGSSARGAVDWVEIGFTTGEFYKFDFVVPEPGSLIALAAGLVGFIGLRRRK